MQRMLNLMDTAMAQIAAKREIVAQLDEHPELILTKLFSPEEGNPYRDFPIWLLGQSHEITGASLRYRDVEKELAQRVKRYFESIDPEIEVVLVDTKSASTSYLITYQGWELIRFDYHFHMAWNGSCWCDSRFERELKSAQAGLECIEELRAKYQGYLNKPFSWANNWRRVLAFPFLISSQKRWWREEVARATDLIDADRREIDQLNKLWDNYLESEQARIRKYEEWKQRFIEEFDYDFSDEWCM